MPNYYSSTVLFTMFMISTVLLFKFFERFSQKKLLFLTAITKPNLLNFLIQFIFTKVGLTGNKTNAFQCFDGCTQNTEKQTALETKPTITHRWFLIFIS